jgi:acetolactate synthase-1/2/3 large subunit
MPNDYPTFKVPASYQPNLDYQVLKEKLNDASRPLVLAGYGIRQSGTVDQFKSFIEKTQVPFVSTYGARDYLPDNHPLNVGTVGIKGSRAGNFALQNADLLIILGSSLGASVIGYDPKQFSPESFKIMIDIDQNEIDKNIIKIDHVYHTSLKKFFGDVL